VALSIFETAFGKDRTTAAPKATSGRRRFDYSKGHYVTSGEAGREKFADTAARTLVAVQTVCDALIPPSAGRYTVAFGGQTAMTERGKRRITITPQPLYTKGMRLADVADTLTGFIIHEIGHVEISGATDEVLSAWLDREPGYLPWRNSIHAISNVIDDHALEVWAKNRFPGVGYTFRVTTKFVAQEQDMLSRPPFAFDPNATFTARFNFMVVATRYRWFVRWSSDPATRRERQWWIDWADTYGDPTDAVLRVEGIKAAIARLAIDPKKRPPEDEPEPQPGKGEGDDSESDEDEDESEPETFDTDDDDDDEDESYGDGVGDDDEDDEDPFEDNEDDDVDPTGGGNDDDDDDEAEDEDEDEESEDESEPGSDVGPLGFNEDGTNDEPEDDGSEDFDAEAEDEDDESESEPESDERPEGGTLDGDDLGQQGEGSNNAPIYEGFDPERLTSDRIKTVDDYTEERQYDRYRDEQLQKQVEVEMRAERVTDTHGFGSMKVVINL
jgi:hypothetical protein